MILAILPITGFLGLDHLYLHSPGTFVLKAILNIFTLGFWYFHDAFQAISHEKEGIAEKGLSVPWFGPSGIGAGSFKTDGVAEAPQNSLLYVGYVLAAMFVPFGLDYVIAGDYLGAVFKYMSIFMFGIGLVYSAINVYKIIMKPAQVFCEGTYRYPPFTFVADSVNPDVAFTTKTGCPPIVAGSAPASIFDFFRGVVRGLDSIPVVGPKLSAPVKVALGTAEAAVAGVETAVASAEAAAKTVRTAVDVAVNKVPAAVSAVSSIASGITPDGLVKVAEEAVAAEGAAAAKGKVDGLGAVAAAANAAAAAKGHIDSLDTAMNAVAAATTKQVGGSAAASASPVIIFAIAALFITSSYLTIQKALKGAREYFADMPPIALPGSPIKNRDRETDVGELPPGASESGFF